MLSSKNTFNVKTSKRFFGNTEYQPGVSFISNGDKKVDFRNRKKSKHFKVSVRCEDKLYETKIIADDIKVTEEKNTTFRYLYFIHSK